MSLADDVRTFILSDTEVANLVGENVTQNRLPQGGQAGIAYRQGSSENDTTRCLNDAPAGEVQFSESFDIEGIDESPDIAGKLVTLLKRHDGHIGAFGAGRVQALFIRDHSDNYTPIGAGTDDARHVAAVEFEILGYEPGS